ncbi:MAG TPA: hypothetical protein VL137_02200, partial [Polyangiaceae bacterium]|nr:hypothetical protein [Polyangiaceae bacterium]
MFLNRNLLSGYCVNAGAAAVLLILATACGPQGESQATSSEQERAGDIANPGAHRTQLPQTEQLDEFSLREGVKIPHSADWVRLGQLGGRVMSLKRGDAQVIFEVDRHDNHRKALERMRSAARELPVVARYSEISGYPVLYRSVIVPAPISEYARESKDTQLYETTLVLIADSVVLEAQARGPVEQGTVTETALAKMIEGIALPANPDTAADLEWLNQAAADDHAELQQARVPLEAPAVFTPHTAEAALAPVGAAQQFAARSEPDVDGEVEVAVDSSGRHMVLANNGEFPVDLTISNNYGFPGSFTDCGTGDPLCSITNQGGPNPTGGGGDPSVAVGASGTFYVASIAQPPGGPGPLPNPACGSMIYASTANASGDITGFSFQAIAAASQTLFADQEHLAADPINSAPGGGDLLYSVYRQFNSCTNPISGQGPFITCSADSGLTWATPVAIGTGDFPRVSVAPNGNALVAYTSGGTIRMARFGQCTPSATPGGLPTIAPIGIPTIVDAAAPVLDCTTGSTPTSTGTAIPGLDRCNVGNDLRSPVAVADPTNSNNVFVIHAEQSAGNAANDNVILTGIDVTGANPPQNFTLNSAAGGHRFMPWLCATGSQVFASWYDMRAANAANNSRLDYFGRSLSVNAGVFTLNPEFQINDVQDSTCATAFPSGVLAVGAGQATSTDECPGSQQAGFCTDTNGAQIYGQCDFSDCGSPLTNNTIVNNPCTCPLDPVVNDGTTRTTCQGRRGEPKYGDYNGNACSGGRLYAAWAAGNPVDVDVMFKCSTNPNNVTATPYVDVTPPVIDVATVPPAQPLSNCQALPLSKPKALDVCGDPSPSISALVSGNPVDLNTFVFPPGPTTINWSAVDVAANVSAPGPATLVTVTDTTSPEFVVPADIVSDSCVVTLSVPTATDACAGSEPV